MTPPALHRNKDDPVVVAEVERGKRGHRREGLSFFSSARLDVPGPFCLAWAMRLFVLLRLGTLDLGSTTEGLLPVLALLPCSAKFVSLLGTII